MSAGNAAMHDLGKIIEKMDQECQELLGSQLLIISAEQKLGGERLTYSNTVKTKTKGIMSVNIDGITDYENKMYLTGTSFAAPSMVRYICQLVEATKNSDTPLTHIQAVKLLMELWMKRDTTFTAWTPKSIQEILDNYLTYTFIHDVPENTDFSAKTIECGLGITTSASKPVSWVLESSADWIWCSQTEGKGVVPVKFIINGNPSTEAREAAIVLKVKNSDAEKSRLALNIYQDASNLVLKSQGNQDDFGINIDDYGLPVFFMPPVDASVYLDFECSIDHLRCEQKVHRGDGYRDDGTVSVSGDFLSDNIYRVVLTYPDNINTEGLCRATVVSFIGAVEVYDLNDVNHPLSSVPLYQKDGSPFIVQAVAVQVPPAVFSDKHEYELFPVSPCHVGSSSISTAEGVLYANFPIGNPHIVGDKNVYCGTKNVRYPTHDGFEYEKKLSVNCSNPLSFCKTLEKPEDYYYYDVLRPTQTYPSTTSEIHVPLQTPEGVVDNEIAIVKRIGIPYVRITRIYRTDAYKQSNGEWNADYKVYFDIDFPDDYTKSKCTGFSVFYHEVTAYGFTVEKDWIQLNIDEREFVKNFTTSNGWFQISFDICVEMENGTKIFGPKLIETVDLLRSPSHVVCSKSIW